MKQEDLRGKKKGLNSSKSTLESYQTVCLSFSQHHQQNKHSYMDTEAQVISVFSGFTLLVNTSSNEALINQKGNKPNS